ncbi:hypothetical protein SAMN05428966_102126 [Massilia sp. PDC64]|nr:hypothetical protein [Massilia sp. PDC64]SDC69239.1 hypothetical protein SAMN05428966_102126 [Massilia sp. PDC64]
MPGETLITDPAPAAAAAPATPAAPAAAAPPAASAPAAGQADGEAAGATPAGGSDGAGTGGNEPGEKSPEQIAADEAAAKAAEEAAKAAGAPEKYEPFTAPEGTALDAAVMTEFETAARELNLPQDAAQKLIDKMAPVMAKQQTAQLEQLRTDWAAASTTDKEFGGDKLTENLGFARKAMDTFGTPELKTMLNETGLGNHPDVVRFMVRAGKAISEDKIVTGGAPASANRSAAEVLYGGAASKK